MFSGIVVSIGTIKEVARLETRDMMVHIAVEDTSFLEGVDIGCSVSCSGVCLTVVEKHRTYFVVSVSEATLSVTNLGLWQTGTKVNLEPSLRVGDRIDGHIVQGHVDGLGLIESITPTLGSHTLRISCNASLFTYITPKGSVTLDGVSMTVNAVGHEWLEVNVIQYTWNHTTFQYGKVNDAVNIETDLIARYLESIYKTAPR